MNITIEDITDTRKKIKLSVPAAEVQAIEQELLGEFAKEAKIQGFRPGKAPVALIRKRFKKEVEQELNKRILTDGLEQAGKDFKLDILTVVSEELPKLELMSDAEASLTVDVIPSFELPEYKGLTITLQSPEPADEEVKKAKKYLLEQRAEFAETDKIIEKGDYVKLSYTGKVGDELIADIAPDKPIWGTQNFTWEEAGAEEGVPCVRSIADGVIGLEKDATAEFEETFGDEFEVEALRGKTAKYSVEIHEIRERKLPELNEEFLKELGVDSEQNLDDKLRDKIRSDKTNNNAMQTRENIMKLISDGVEFELPESAIESRTREVLSEMIQYNTKRGVTEAQLADNKDDLFAQSADRAKKRVKAQLLLNEIAKQEKIELDEETLKNAIFNECQHTNTKPEVFIKELRKDSGRLERLKMIALEEKILQFLEKNANITVLEEVQPEASA